MSRVHLRAAVGVAFLSGALGLGLLVWAPPPSADAKAQPPVDERNVLQGFPAKTADPADPLKSDTAWFIQWDITSPYNRPGFSMPPASVLRILSAMFMYKDRHGQPRWITVVKDLRLAEMFVP